MKIKMITCVVSVDLLTYNAGNEFTVGENISKELAESFVKANFAVVVEEKKEKETVKRKRGKKDEV